MIGGIVALALIPVYISGSDSSSSATTQAAATDTVTETVLMENVATVSGARTIFNGTDFSEMANIVKIIISKNKIKINVLI